MIRLRFDPEVTLTAAGDGELTVEHPVRGRTVLRDLDGGTADALVELLDRPMTPEEVTAPGLDRLAHEVDRLTGWGLLRLACTAGGDPIAEAVMTSELAARRIVRLNGTELIAMSRFTYMRRSDDTFVIESPTGYSRVTLADPTLAGVLALLAGPVTVAAVCERMAGPEEATHSFLELLVTAGAVAVADADGRLPEDLEPAIVQREFHDVLAHQWSRRGLSDNVYGGPYLFLDRYPPLPAVRPREDHWGEPIALPAPDLDLIRKNDPPMADVMERRRSTRDFGSAPLTLDQLGEFLYRVARVRSERPIDRANNVLYAFTDRPTPSGGAGHDLEYYLTVWSCAGLGRGTYHYDPAGHSLALVTTDPKALVGMLNEAHYSIGRTSMPGVLVTLASRFNRLAWKYRSISYALTLKNTGAVYQSAYLVANAMGIGVCGLGGGNSAVFSKATGLDPMVESSVGEFVLGSLSPSGEKHSQVSPHRTKTADHHS